MESSKKVSSKDPFLVALLRRRANVICFAAHTLGFLAFALLSWAPLNDKTYFSENALLPGLVSRESNVATQTLSLLASLEEEAKTRVGFPHAWLMAQFRQAGLEVYKHNFTLQYPIGARAKHRGENVYAILRAPRSASTEALVLSAPYRAKESIHPTTLPGIALMVSLAKFFRRHHYWSKDIIFVVTEHELVGLQAWLDAYHAVNTAPGVIKAGYLEARAGVIQAALNLEIHAPFIRSVDLKFLGLNGQLPNLDLFNLAIDLCQREGVDATLFEQEIPYESESFEGWKKAFETLLLMIQGQCTGLPNGAHGLFYRYGIQAITLEGHGEDTSGDSRYSLSYIGRVVEGIFRSLNNLLERFHQSYFYYLLPSAKRFICISYYMPAFFLLCGPVLLKAGDAYYSLTSEETGPSLRAAFFAWVCAMFVGGSAFAAAPYADSWIRHPSLFPHLSTQDALYVAAVVASIIPIVLAPFLNRSRCASVCKAKRCLLLLSFGALCSCIATLNISMAIVLAVFYVPMLFCAGANMPRWLGFLHRLLQLVMHPLCVTYLAILIQSLASDDWHWNSLKLLVPQAFAAHRRTLLYCLEDWLIYGNVTFVVLIVGIYPIWVFMWSLRNPNVESKKILSGTKTRRTKVTKPLLETKKAKAE